MNAKLLLPFGIAITLAACGGETQRITVRRDAAPAALDEVAKNLLAADYRYSPSWWQTAICLPDDWQKTLVSKEGDLLYDYEDSPSGFATRVSLGTENLQGATAVQSMADPRVPIVETVLNGPDGTELMRWSSMAVVPGKGQNLPVYRRSHLQPAPDRPARGDLLLVKRATGGRLIRLTIEAKAPLEAVGRTVSLGGRRFLSSSAPWKSLIKDKNRLVLVFPDKVQELAVYAASGHEPGEVDLGWARTQPERAVAYWASRDFPYDVIRIPDQSLQGLLDSCIRNIYQAREVKDGLPVFQVGPTCYRGLWVVDGAFILEAMAYLGRGQEARAGIRYLLTRQKPDGSFEILDKYWKENGIVLYILYRHALLTGDLGWLKEQWPTVRRVVGVIQRLRRESGRSPAAPEAGLMPPGFPDGGIGGVVPEYTNVYWNLAGLKAAVEAARLIGAPELADWESEFSDFWATFERASARDSRPLSGGLRMLPVLMQPQTGVDPVRGQWAFCHGVFPGKLFTATDPLARGNMALLDEHQKEGLVLGTGWMADGIWNYFGSFWAHAHLWLGDGAKASEILYAYANHASPLRAWREEQPPKGENTQAPFVGDMPHNWASAEFIRLTRNLLVLERGAELHFLEGLPRTWLAPGARTELRNCATDFGPVSFSLEVAPDGLSARISIIPPRNPSLRAIVVHLGAWAADRRFKTQETEEGFELDVPLVPRARGL